MRNRIKLCESCKGFLRRLSVVVIMTSAVCLTSCGTSAASRKTTNHSDSLTTVRKVTTYESVPKRTTTLAVSADRLLNVTRLPEGYGTYVPAADSTGVNINITSDGMGGINITASTDETLRQTTIEEETATRIRDETESSNEKQKTNKTVWITVGVLLAIGVYVVIKWCLNRI